MPSRPRGVTDHCNNVPQTGGWIQRFCALFGVRGVKTRDELMETCSLGVTGGLLRGARWALYHSTEIDPKECLSGQNQPVSRLDTVERYGCAAPAGSRRRCARAKLLSAGRTARRRMLPPVTRHPSPAPRVPFDGEWPGKPAFRPGMQRFGAKHRRTVRRTGRWRWRLRAQPGTGVSGAVSRGLRTFVVRMRVRSPLLSAVLRHFRTAGRGPGSAGVSGLPRGWALTHPTPCPGSRCRVSRHPGRGRPGRARRHHCARVDLPNHSTVFDLGSG